MSDYTRTGDLTRKARTEFRRHWAGMSLLSVIGAVVSSSPVNVVMFAISAGGFALAVLLHPLGRRA